MQPNLERYDKTCSLIDSAKNTIPIYLIAAEQCQSCLARLAEEHQYWANINGFSAKLGEMLILPDKDNGIAGVVFGLGDKKARVSARFATGALPAKLPQGDYRLQIEETATAEQIEEYVLGWILGQYRIRENSDKPQPRLAAPEHICKKTIEMAASATFMARDLINMPANLLGPVELHEWVSTVGKCYDAQIDSIVGDDLLAQNYPLIHTVGRTGEQAPRLIDLRWGRSDAPKLTLVGKGVTFDSGGLDIKPRQAMRWMKKDMGGAAAALACGQMVMEANLPVRLRLLIPSLENGIGAGAFRPGDIIKSRKDLLVEVSDTDAEGRLILADTLAEADSESPDWLFNFATLTGAARVALGPDIVPFYTDDEVIARTLLHAGKATCDPLWQMPLWKPYEPWLASTNADLESAPSGGFAGSITSALFLRRFVENAKSWVHFDLFGWTPKALPGRPVGGECQAARAAFRALSEIVKPTTSTSTR